LGSNTQKNCKRQTAIETSKPLATFWSHNYGKNLALPSWDDTNQFRDWFAQHRLLVRLYDAHGT